VALAEIIELAFYKVMLPQMYEIVDNYKPVVRWRLGSQ